MAATVIARFESVGSCNIRRSNNSAKPKSSASPQEIRSRTNAVTSRRTSSSVEMSKLCDSGSRTSGKHRSLRRLPRPDSTQVQICRERMRKRMQRWWARRSPPNRFAAIQCSDRFSQPLRWLRQKLRSFVIRSDHGAGQGRGEATWVLTGTSVARKSGDKMGTELPIQVPFNYNWLSVAFA